METTASLEFQHVYGEPPAGVWAAPGRVNLIGEHTDYNQGFVLPFAIPQRTYAAAAPLPDQRWTFWSAQTRESVTVTPEDLVPGKLTGWAAYPAGVIWALRTAGHRVPGARLAISSEVPTGSGLSSSAALVCSVLLAMIDLAELATPLADRPALAHRAESQFVGVPCGPMDQSASLLGQAGRALFLDCRTGHAEQIPLDLTAAGLSLLVIDTRSPHRLAEGDYAVRRTSCEEAAQALGVPALRDLSVDGLDRELARLDSGLARRRVRHVVTENQRVLDTVSLLHAGRIRSIGPLLTASHASLRDDFEVTGPELDTAVDAALAAGARGARMTGGGFGGCAIALVEAEATESVAATVVDAFAARGFTAPETFVAAPADGAARVTDPEADPPAG